MRVVVFTVCTDIDTGLINWISSAERFGYTYQILGLGENWQGWPYRTGKYIKAVSCKDINDYDIVVLFMSFFTDTCQTLQQKFVNGGWKVVVGAESACCTAEHDHPDKKPSIMAAFEKLHPSNRNRFPNGGCVVGTKKICARSY
ncbi:MAG: glycosyltransferase domain-containing protein [Nitrososphaerales archaeon]